MDNSGLIENIRRLVPEVGAATSSDSDVPLADRLAEALGWKSGIASTENVPGQARIQLQSLRGTVDDQPALLFVNDKEEVHHTIEEAAFFAYHASIEWGVIADLEEVVFFNSHWLQDGGWYQLPPIKWDDLDSYVDLLEVATPEGVTKDHITQAAFARRQPSSVLIPVDDALVERLDYWREETLRHTRQAEGIDEKLQTLFAQMFVLRACEDRNLAPDIVPLYEARLPTGDADLSILRDIFDRAIDTIQSELFEENVFQDFPAFVLGGIIHDLYIPHHLPIGNDLRYNFAWIDADVLGRAYEKYLSSLVLPSPATSPQLRLWQQPVREVERVESVRKKSGVYYTPTYLVRFLTERSLDHFYETAEHSTDIPRIADLSAGSGSFLVSAVDSLIRRLRQVDPERNWGEEIVSGKRIVGIDNDPRAVTLARLSIWLRLAEEPSPLPLPRLEEVIVHGDSLAEETWSTLPDQYDVFLGNPPFMATGRFPSRQELVNRFKTAQGRFDYSYLFIEQAMNKLSDEGILSMVVPNRLFRNRDASSIRYMLTSEAELLTVVDFGSTEVFSGTNAYIGTIVARKSHSEPSSENVRVIRVTEVESKFIGVLLSRADQGEDDYDHILAYYSSYPKGPGPWLLLSPGARRARVRLDELSEPLSSYAEMHQGIRTGANDIFILELQALIGDSIAQVRNGLGDIASVETALLRPVTYGSNTQRYSPIVPEKYLLYPYRLDTVIPEPELRDEFPLVYEYLNLHRSLLADRSSLTNSGIRWYELIRKRDEAWLNKRKLLTRDLATRPSFAIDQEGGTYLVGGAAVVPEDQELLFALLGYLNSNVVGWYLSQITPSFKSGFQKFEPQHLQTVPVLREVVEDDDLRYRLGEMALLAVEAQRSYDDDIKQTEYETLIDNLLCEVLGLDINEVR